MTTADMILRVRQSTRQIDSYVRGALFTEEILLQLNIAQDQFQFLKYKKGQTDPKELVDLRTLQDHTTIAPEVSKVTAIVNASEFLFPGDFRFIISAHGLYTGATTKKVDVIPEEISEQFIRTVNNVPVLRTLKGYVSNNRMIVLSDPFDTGILNLELNYYRKPVEITDIVDCEFPEHTHDVICEIAVNRIVGRTVPEEYQISSDILNKSE